MKELEWIKELEEDFKSGDKERFPTMAHNTYWENVPADEENRELMKGINKIYMPFAKKGDYAEMRHLGEYYSIGRRSLQLPINYKKAIFWYSRAAEYKSDIEVKCFTGWRIVISTLVAQIKMLQKLLKCLMHWRR